MHLKGGISLGIAILIFFTANNMRAAEDFEKLIGPKPSPERQYFDCSNSSLWSNAYKDRGQVGLSREGGMTAFHWKGWDTEIAQLITSGERLPLKRGYNDSVRVVWEIKIDAAEYGGFINPTLVIYDASGKQVSSIGVGEQNQPTGPDGWRTVGLTWKPGEKDASAALALNFTGNAVKARIKSVYIEPAQPKPGRGWNTQERGKFRVPDVSYEVDKEVPKEDTVKITPEEIDKLLAKREKAIPKLEQYENRVQLTVNNKNVPPAVYLSSAAGLQSSYFGDMAEVGFPVAAFLVKAGPKSDTPGAPGNIWLGKGKYDFEPIREGIRYILARAPNTYIMLELIVNVYNDWGIEHPGDIHTNSKGEKGICGWSRVTRYGGPPPGPNEFWEASNFSAQFREDGSQMLKDLGKWLESIPEGKVVIGAYLNGSADGQWLFSNEWEFADYSEGTLKAFRAYLKEKYKDNEALNKAWQTTVKLFGKDVPTSKPVTLETAEIPSFGLRTRQKGRNALMSFNGKEAQAADYNDFLSVANTRRQIAFSRGLKEGTNNRLLAGSYWPTSPCAYPLCHGNFKEMLASPYVDFISPGGTLDALFRGKLTIDEYDLRNLKSGIEGWINYDEPYIAKSQGEFKRQALAHFCRSFAEGGGFHLMDMWGGWYWRPETQQIIKEALAISQYIKNPPSLGDDYVGVFVDEDAANHLSQLGRYYLYSSVEVPSFGALANCGLPVRFFLMSDALNPNLETPRVSIFLNPLTMTLEQGEAIKKKFQRDGRVVVYMLAPGLAAPGDAANPEKITGLKVVEDEQTINKPLFVKTSDDPLLSGIRPGTILCHWNEHMQWYANYTAQPDKDCRVLAYYAKTDIPGMLAKRNPGWTEVWIGSTGALTPTLVRNFAREAGMTPILENDNELMIGAGFLAVMRKTDGGPQKVNLPKNYVIEKCVTGHTYQVKNGILTFDLDWKGDAFGDIAIFSVKGK